MGLEGICLGRLTGVPRPPVKPALPRTQRRGASVIDPAWFLVLFAVAIPLSPEMQIGGYSKVRLTDLLLVPALLTFLGAAATSKRKKSRHTMHPVLVAMGLVLAWDFARLLLMPGDFRPGQLDTGMNYLVKRTEYFLIFFLGMMAAWTPGRLQHIMSRFYLAAPLMNLFVLYQYWKHAGDGEVYRASGLVAAQPNSTAMFIVGNFTVALCLLPTTRNRLERNALLLAIVSGVGALLATGSREGLVCMMLVVGIVAAINRQVTPRNIVAFFAVSLVVWQFAPDGVQSRLQTIPQEFNLAAHGLTGEGDMTVDSGHSSLAARINIASDVLNDVFPESPLIGFGTAYYSLGAIDNTYVAELIYHGLIGLGLFLLLIFQLAKMIKHGLRMPGADQLTICYSRAMGICLLVMLVGGFAMESFYVIRPMETFFLFMGLLAGQIGQIEAREEQSNPTLRPHDKTFGHHSMPTRAAKAPVKLKALGPARRRSDLT